MTLVHELSYSHQLEMVVLGYALSSADGLRAVCALLKKEDFHSPKHQVLFSVLREICQKGLSLDIPVLCEALQKQKFRMAESCLIRMRILVLDREQAHGCMEEVRRLSLMREILQPDFFSHSEKSKG